MEPEYRVHPEQIQRDIEQMAYYLWEYAGHPHDNSWEYWFEAERIVLSNQKVSEPFTSDC
jgi:hypothetical protein